MPDVQAHHPHHVYLDDAWYFITASTVAHQRYFHSDAAKEIWRDKLKSLVSEFSLKLSAWVILDNHYHLLFKNPQAKFFSRFIGRLHGSTSREINVLDQQLGRKIWDNYWDICIRTEDDYWRRMNYIHHNPVKHGYTKEMKAWRFSSYRWYLEKKGEDWVIDCFLRYPIQDFTERD